MKAMLGGASKARAACLALLLGWTGLAAAEGPASPKTFSETVAAVAARPEYRHAMFGVEVYSLDEHKTLFSLNGDKLFTPGSTTKLLTAGTALALLGAEHRFHTPVYRTAAIGRKGVIKGDLVLVAAGDPNLSNRIQPDGTLAFADQDHSYGGPDSRLLPGDPLIVLQTLAKTIAGAGVKRVTGNVFIDVSLFPERKRSFLLAPSAWRARRSFRPIRFPALRALRRRRSRSRCRRRASLWTGSQRL